MGHATIWKIQLQRSMHCVSRWLDKPSSHSRTIPRSTSLLHKTLMPIKTHRELYSYVIDGLDKQTIGLISAHHNLALNLNSDYTVKALKRAQPLLPPNSL